MNYYQHHIGDFNNATRHLTRQERSIYRDLIELQYDLETPIPNDLDWICRKVLARGEQERTDVERTLNEFFDLFEQGWSNSRCEEEIEAFSSKRQAAIKAGKASGRARRRNKNSRNNKKIEQPLNENERTLNERCDFVEPTNNHKPITNIKKNIKKKNFTKPKPGEIQAYCDERKNGLDGQQIFDHYEANGWFRGKNKIKDWQACVRTWESRNPVSLVDDVSGLMETGAMI